MNQFETDADPQAALEDALALAEGMTEAAKQAMARAEKAEAEVRDLREMKAVLVLAITALSPWKLQDCWCSEDDHGGNKAHTPPCLVARAALKTARGGA